MSNTDQETDAEPAAEGRGRGARIERIEPLTPTSTLVRLAGPKLVGFRWTPGDHVRIPIGNMFTLRTYSIWDGDPRAGWLELVLFDHGTPNSVGLDWAAKLQLGQHVRLVRDPRTFKIEPTASFHLFVGEETAAAGFGAMIRSLPATADVRGVIQANTAADHIGLPRPLRRIERDGRPAAASQQLVDAVAALDLPDLPGIAYLAGEARTIQMVRSQLVGERGWPRRNVRTKPFWTPGKRGMD